MSRTTDQILNSEIGGWKPTLSHTNTKYVRETKANRKFHRARGV